MRRSKFRNTYAGVKLSHIHICMFILCDLMLFDSSSFTSRVVIPKAKKMICKPAFFTVDVLSAPQAKRMEILLNG